MVIVNEFIEIMNEIALLKDLLLVANIYLTKFVIKCGYVRFT